MTTPGLYRHFKGQHYRVLCVAEWTREPPVPNGVVSVCLVDGTWLAAVNADSAWAKGKNSLFHFFAARWAGNDNCPLSAELVVVYIALYDEGHLWVRTEREFKETVDVGGAPELGMQGPRFERIGD